MAVVATKLHVPRQRRALVRRARLTAIISGGSASVPRLVLLAAPAGFGKTTVLTQWLSEDVADAALAWLSLDDGDNDLRRFLTHLVASVQAGSTTGTPVGSEAMTMVGTEGTVAAPVVIVSLVNDLDT